MTIIFVFYISKFIELQLNVDLRGSIFDWMLKLLKTVIYNHNEREHSNSILT